MSADTVAQDLTNPQSLNRYSYVLNNPLRYTDPSGRMIAGYTPPLPQVIVDPPPAPSHDNGSAPSLPKTPSPDQSSGGPTLPTTPPSSEEPRRLQSGKYTIVWGYEEESQTVYAHYEEKIIVTNEEGGYYSIAVGGRGVGIGLDFAYSSNIFQPGENIGIDDVPPSGTVGLQAEARLVALFDFDASGRANVDSSGVRLGAANAPVYVAFGGPDFTILVTRTTVSGIDPSAAYERVPQWVRNAYYNKYGETLP